MKKVMDIFNAPGMHWVGDGFPVRSMFSYQQHARQMTPFLLLDYAGPAEFEPADQPRGVGEHPHRGFETVTIVYRGEVAHRDSTGKGGVIGPGDVQWMTAGAGILHEEFHSPAFTKTGGELEMVQLWVNLPASDKMTPPTYQAIVDKQIPAVPLPEDAGMVRVIAGAYEGHEGPASTFTPMNVWDVRLKQGASRSFTLPQGWTAGLVVLHGEVTINGDRKAQAAQLVVLDRDGQDFRIEAVADTTFLILSGEPIDEPVVGYGPFVMNTREEIMQAMADFNSGHFGQI